VELVTWQIKRRRPKLNNNNNNTNQIPSQRDALSVDKKVTLHMSVKLLHHNPCPSMLRPFAFNAHYMLRKNSSGKMKVIFLGLPNKNRPKKI
jgi:hypothetical protein